MGLGVHAFPNSFGRRPEAHYQRMALEARKIFCIGSKPPASGDHGLLHLRQFGNDLFFDAAEYLLSGLSENVGDASGGPRLNELICIQKPEVQMGRRHSSDRRFASPHKADQNQVMDCARRAHRPQFI